MMHWQRSRRDSTAWACMGWLLAATIAGCGGGSTGPPTARVWGEVTYDGKPLPEGRIELTPAEGTAGGAAAGAIKDGKYDIPTAEGPIVGGTYRVEISANRPVGKPLVNIIEPGGPPMQNFENYIPLKYNRNSTLSATISADSSKNQFDYQLEAGRRR